MTVSQKYQCSKMILLLGLLSVLRGEPALCLQEDGGFTFDGNIRQFAVASNSVYIATEERLYQLSHDLTLINSLTQRGILNTSNQPDDVHFYRVSDAAAWNSTFSVNVLLPFSKSGSLISCGVTDDDCGHCEVLDLKNISNLLYRERIQVGPLKRSSASVSFLVDVTRKSRTDTYILTAIQHNKGQPEDKCGINHQTINLQDTDDKQGGGIFSLTDGGSGTPGISSKVDVEFVDGFQVSSTIYLLSNALSGQTNRVRLIWLQGDKSKSETLKSLRGATLSISDSESSRLVASSVIPGEQPVLWSGVFSVDGGDTNTELMVFDISADGSGEPDKDPDFQSSATSTGAVTPKILKPKAVLFRQSSMTSVLAVRLRAWMVFFIGTGDGQLIKLAVDRNYHIACPTVLYRTNDDHKVFPRMHLDPVDHKHVYVPFRNQMQRVPVSQCSTNTHVQECWSAQDPYCVWCASKTSCTFEADCTDSDWLSIPDDSQHKMISHRVEKGTDGQISLKVHAHLTVGQEAASNFTCHFSAPSNQPCGQDSPPPQFPQCTCVLNATLPPDGLNVSVTFRLGTTELTERVRLTSCSDVSGPPTSALCQQCVQAGCAWNQNKCSWANHGETNDSVCQKLQSGMNFSIPQISSITPRVVSFYGRNHAVLTGRDLGDVTAVRIWTHTQCTPKESPVWNNTGVSLTFHIPRSDIKGVVNVCVLLPDGSCHGEAQVNYSSLPSCSSIAPSSSWLSGKRNIILKGSHLELVEGIMHSHTKPEVIFPTSIYDQNLTYESPAASAISSSTVSLKVANETLDCATKLSYHPDPEFTSVTATRMGDDVRITVQKKADKLQMTTEELSVWGVQGDDTYPCIMEAKGINGSFTCGIKNPPNPEFQLLLIEYGAKSESLKFGTQSYYFLMLIFVILLIPCVIVVGGLLYHRQQHRFTDKMNRYIEDIELNIRNDIRQGFVELQTESADLLENVGAIPFLDFKHFASRIFFPENESLMESCIKDIGQDGVKMQLDEACQGLSKLIQDRLFLTSMVHALEDQKSFTIKDKCAVASLLTVALHSNLLYMTEVMEVLLKDLMQKNSNTQPKLLLRRTESIVEKLLTNWMSICLYGFLRETVGQHLFVMVSALTQQIAKGPVDCVTGRALYTLSEDWLLWQAQDFSSLTLKVLFAVGSDGEVSEPLEVDALTCDTVEQVKEKILSTFKAKFGFPYNIPLRDVCLQCEKNGTFTTLEEVGARSQVIGEVTKLNTLKHYEVKDGGTIKVLAKNTHPPLSPQGSLKDDENFSGKYFHLIDPDVDEDQRKSPERKKLKLKEVHLTKLLSTKVAVHSFVEKLFRSIWGLTLSRSPFAIKYFFDFLDSQAENMKITDPDVLHIWKTNSLPLRFWINILKNPQFVFDMEKTPHVDGCLSVIAQAFMDSFSLSETQLGKYAPTNKLLYAKDIPKFKQEVKMYYKQIRDQSPVTDAELKDFLHEESKKHENEFNEAAALREIHKFIQRYFTEIQQKLDENGAPAELKEQLQHVKQSFDGLKSCSWN